MYSRSQTGRSEGAIRLPEHYSGVAFDRARPVEFCADGLPLPRLPEPTPAPADECRGEEEHDCGHDCGRECSHDCDRHHVGEHHEGGAGHRECENPPPGGEGLLGAIGGEELLLLGVIFLLSQRQGEDDTILLLLLLLLRR